MASLHRRRGRGSGDGEQERRIGLPGRSEFHKLTSLETLRRLRNCGPDIERPPVDLEIDTDRSDAPRSAVSIAEYFGLTPQSRFERYPADETNGHPDPEPGTFTHAALRTGRATVPGDSRSTR